MAILLVAVCVFGMIHFGRTAAAEWAEIRQSAE